VKFLFLTKEQQVVKEAISTRKLNPEEFIITSSARNKVPSYISICDASIFFIIPTYSKKASAATKMGEVMAMGKPVITNTGWGDVDKIIPKSNSGIIVKEFSSQGYHQAITSFETISFNPLHIREAAQEHFSLENGIQKYSEIYHKLSAD
jgi:glycosyltransferase involved in cell wall biosynthesis